MKITSGTTLVFLFTIFFCGTSFAVNIYVDQNTGSNSNDGLTPGNALRTITRGLNLTEAGDTLIIGAGRYRPSEGENFPFFVQQNINLQGAGPDLTVVDAQGSASIFRFPAVANEVNIDGMAFINSDDSALKFNSLFVNLSNCRFEDNEQLVGVGAGMTLRNITEVNITDCQFLNNVSAGDGSAIHMIFSNVPSGLINITRSTFIGNGGVNTLELRTIGANTHTLNVDQSTFIDNRIGLGIDSDEGTAVSLVSNSIFADNTTSGVEAVDVEIELVNNTFVNNLYAFDVGASADIVNSIIWGNQLDPRGTGASISFSIVEDLDFGNHIDGGNNIDADPLLDSNYRLLENSPAIDMGDDQVVDDFGLALDIDLEPRKIKFFGSSQPGSLVDIGADEKLDLIFKNSFETQL